MRQRNTLRLSFVMSHYTLSQQTLKFTTLGRRNLPSVVQTAPVSSGEAIVYRLFVSCGPASTTTRGCSFVHLHAAALFARATEYSSGSIPPSDTSLHEPRLSLVESY